MEQTLLKKEKEIDKKRILCQLVRKEEGEP